MIFPAIYAIVAGILMFAQWGFLLAKGRVPELQTAPAEIATHLAAEFLTALALILAGLGLLLTTAWSVPLALFAFGMVIYALINSSGYFVQRRDWPPVVMFAILLLLTFVSTLIVIRTGLVFS